MTSENEEGEKQEGPRSVLQYLRCGGKDDVLDLLIEAGRVVDVGKLFKCDV